MSHRKSALVLVALGLLAGAPVNHPPVIFSTPPPHASCTDGYEYTVQAKDQENDALAYTLLKGPKGMAIDPKSGKLTWKPEWGAPDADVEIQVTDARGASATQAFRVVLSPLYKLAAFGDVTHFAVPLDDEFLCGVTHSRLKTFRRANITDVACSHWTPSRIGRSFEHYKGHVYLPQCQAGVDIFDVSDPRAIRLVGNLAAQVAAYGQLAIIGDKLLVPDTRDMSLRVFSLADPGHPREVVHYVTPPTAALPGGLLAPTKLTVVGRTLYALGMGGLAVFDIGDLERIELLGSIAIRSQISLGALVVRPPHAYVFAGHEIRVFDVSDPAAIRQVGVPQPRTWCSDAVLRGKTFTGYGSNGIFQYSLADPLKPHPEGSFHNRIAGFFIPGKDHDFLVNDAGKAAPMDPAQKVSLRSDRFALSPDNIVVEGRFAYVSAGSLNVLDISNPRQPKPLSTLQVPTVSRSTMFLEGTTLYSTWAIVDVSDPKAPRLLSRLQGGSGIARRADGTLFTGGEKGLTIWDAKDTANPKVLKTVPFDEPIYRLFVRGDVLYIGFKSATLAAYRIGDDLTLTPLSRLPLRRTEMGVILDLRADNRFLYVALNRDGVAAIELKDPANLALHSHFQTDQFAEQVRGVGGFAYVADGSGGIVIVDLLEKGPGRLVGSYPTADWARALDISGPYVYLCESHAGLSIFASDLLTAARKRAVGF